MTPEPTQWHGSEAQRQRVAMLLTLHLQPRTLPPMPFNDTDRVSVRELVNDFDEMGRSRWREPYPEEAFRR